VSITLAARPKSRNVLAFVTCLSPIQRVLPTVNKIQISELINSELAQAEGALTSFYGNSVPPKKAPRSPVGSTVLTLLNGAICGEFTEPFFR
jgi:hypothetical protein